uniref:adenylate kinase n=1 Tax=Oryza brachyantha TaxID=4533 RepID=J3MN46_ORYBR
MGSVVDAPAVVVEEGVAENMLGGKKVTVVFVLGGPGSGKGTQCANIVEHFGFTHLSAGDLLRAEIKSGSENGYIIISIHKFLWNKIGSTSIFSTRMFLRIYCYFLIYRTMIENMIKEGKIVPSEVTIKLLQEAMIKNENDKFLIDGFPRNEENRAAFENVVSSSTSCTKLTTHSLLADNSVAFFPLPLNLDVNFYDRLLFHIYQTKISPAFVLFFDCSEEEMERRLLGRNQGRVDDNIETIRKRFKVFVESSLPVIEHYNAKDKVKKIDAAKPIAQVFEDVKAIFAPYAKALLECDCISVIMNP